MYWIKFVEAIETYILCSIIFFSEIIPLMRYCGEKYRTARQDGEDNIMRRRQDAISMPDNYGKNTCRQYTSFVHVVSL